MGSFFAFLGTIKTRKQLYPFDYSSDFAHDACRDELAPVKSSSKKRWAEYLSKCGAITEAIDGFEQAWHEYKTGEILITPANRILMCGRYGEGRCDISCEDKDICDGFGRHNIGV